MSSPRQAAFIFIFMSAALDMLALGIMVPVLPKLLVLFEGGNHAKAAQVTGIFSFAWALMQFLASPLIGSLSDRFGRRPVLLLSSLGLGLDYVLMALAPNLGWLFVGRLISGVTTATYSTAAAYIADITPPEKRAGRFGMLGAAFGIGFIIGPAVGGVLGQIDLRLPFWVAAGLSFVNTLYGFFVLPESLPVEKRSPLHWKVANPLGAFKFIADHPTLTGLFVATFLSYLAHESLPSMFVLYTDYRFHWDEKTVGYVLGAVGFTSMIVAAGLTRRLVKSAGEKTTLLLGLGCGAVGFTWYGLAWSPTLFLMGMPFVALMGLNSPAIQAMMSGEIGDTKQGQLQGVLSSLKGISGMAGPLLFTQSFALATATGAEKGLLPVGIPYYLAGGLLSVSFVLVLFCKVQRVSKTKAELDASKQPETREVAPITE
jgi:MFS transporter, DHA1 family, tetracycline resistance protein